MAFVASGPFDVLAHHRILDRSSEFLRGDFEPFILGDTVAIPTALTDEPACILTLVADALVNETERVELEACWGASMGAALPGRGAYAICTVGNLGVRPLVALYEMEDHHLIARVDVEDLGPGAANPGDDEVSCRGLAATRAGDALVVATTTSEATAADTRATIFRADLDADLAVEWITSLRASSFWEPIAGFNVGAVSPGGPGATSPAGAGVSAIRGLALTSTGIVVTLNVACPCEPTDPGVSQNPFTTLGANAFQTGMVWLDHEGFIQGTRRSGSDSSPAGPVATSGHQNWVANWPAAQGALAAVPIGGYIVIVNPDEDNPIALEPFRSIETSSGFLGVEGPAWWRDRLVAPLSKSVTTYDPDDLTRPLWSWSHGPEWDVSSVVISPPSDVFVAMTTANEEGFIVPVVYRLSLETGGLLQRIDLPDPNLPRPGDTRYNARFFPLPDGNLAFIGQGGDVIVLGPSPVDERPTVTLSTAYPRPLEIISATVAAPPGASVEEYVVYWGDGEVSSATRGETVTHRYGVDEPHLLRATAVYGDGTTRTAEVVVHVGETPPPELNALQTIFAPENQDLTFGVLGILVAVTGGVIAVGRTRRKRNLLQRELDAVERAYESTRDDPPACLSLLEDRRTHARGLVLDGKLEEAQLSVLHGRINELERSLRTSVVARELDFLPNRIVQALDRSLADGRVTRLEADAIRRAIDEDPIMTPAQKKKALALLSEELALEGFNGA